MLKNAEGQVVRCVLLNGPPRSGKDTLAKWLKEGYDGATIFNFAEPVKEGVHRSLNLVGSKGVAWNQYEECKDSPHPDFFGRTPRQAYIAYAEDFMKPTFGKGIFAALVAEQLRVRVASGLKLVVITDLGFKEELDEIVEVFGPEMTMVVQIDRPGCTFKNDSRTYVHYDPVHKCKVHNTEGNPEVMFNQALYSIEEFMRYAG